MAEDVFELADSLGLKKVKLIGHSMGGKVGMTLAARYPDLLEKLVVVDIAPKQYPVQHRNILDGLLNTDLYSVNNRKQAEDRLAKYVPELSVRQFLLKNLDRTNDGGFRWKLNLKIINDHIEDIGKATIPDRVIKIPTMFIRGINSHYVSDGDVMEIRTYFSDSVIESIGNAGHWVHAEQPKAFIETVMDFLGY